MSFTFDWDSQKNAENKAKHGINFETAQYVFFDPHRLIIHDSKHSELEERWFCIGKVKKTCFNSAFYLSLWGNSYIWCGTMA